MIYREAFPVSCDECNEGSTLIEWSYKAATREEAHKIVREMLAGWGWRYDEETGRDICSKCNELPHV